MKGIRFLTKEQEPVEFRPIAGMESDWARFNEPTLSAMWLWCGAYPLLGLLSLSLALIGSVLLGG